MPRITDKQKKKIIADYLELGSYNATAKKNGICKESVRRIIMANPDFSRKAQQKNDENTADVLAHMDAKKETVNEIIDKALDVLNDKRKLESTGAMQLATMLGIIIDKFTGTRATVEKLKAELARAKTDVKADVEDDPITKALKEELHGAK